MPALLGAVTASSHRKTEGVACEPAETFLVPACDCA